MVVDRKTEKQTDKKTDRGDPLLKDIDTIIYMIG